MNRNVPGIDGEFLSEDDGATLFCDSCGEQVRSNEAHRCDGPADPPLYLLVGNPLDGLSLVGPFPDAETAGRYGEHLGGTTDWWIVTPDEPTPEQPVVTQHVVDRSGDSLSEAERLRDSGRRFP